MSRNHRPTTSSPSHYQALPFSKQRFALSLALLLIAIFAGSLRVAHAQSNGEITGTVTDPTGAVVPNVDVKVTSVETGNSHATKTNGAGIFDFPWLGQRRLQPSGKLHRLPGLS